MRMHKNILGGGHLLGNNSPVARRYRCAGAGRPLLAHGFRRAFRFASAPRAVAAGASLALVLLAGALLFPAIPDAAQAEEAGTKATLVVHPMLSVELQSAVNFDVMPTQDGAFSSSAATLSVSTNNETGYSLYLSTANGESTLASLNPSATDTIGAVTGTVSEDGFGDNTWGYNLSEGTPSGSLTYQAVPGDSTVQQGFGSEGPIASDIYTLTFGTKVNTSLPSGTYSNQVVVSVVANPGYVVDYFNGISTMQEMTTEVCQTAAANETARLRDTRDGKLYWVAKLADGKQNLDLDLSTDTALTPDDSDVSASWTPAMSTQTTLSSGEFTSGTDGYNGVRSFDPGMYVNNNPTAWTSCNSYWSGGSCSNWTEVSSMTAMTEERTDGTMIDGNTYDAHYLAGNYYQWNAATAGTGEQATSYNTNATDSICPKGWKLPTSNNSNSGSFGGLTSAYSISNNSTGATALTKSPLYFIPAGYVYSGSLVSAGNSGDYWSSTAFSSDYAYNLYFKSGRVNPSNFNGRHGGQPVRCLAR